MSIPKTSLIKWASHTVFLSLILMAIAACRETRHLDQIPLSISGVLEYEAGFEMEVPGFTDRKMEKTYHIINVFTSESSTLKYVFDPSMQLNNWPDSVVYSKNGGWKSYFKNAVKTDSVKESLTISPTDSVKMILGFNARKYTGTVDGRKIIVWASEKLPQTATPIPGNFILPHGILILEIPGEITYTAIDFKKNE